MNANENFLRAVNFDRPDYIPMTFHVNPACWNHYPVDELKQLMLDHPMLFPDFRPEDDPVPTSFEPWSTAGEPFVDCWGCKWETTENGIVGSVTGHPLANWDNFDRFSAAAPDPAKYNGRWEIDWDSLAAEYKNTLGKDAGAALPGGLMHGHTWLMLCDIRGYENTLFDMIENQPRLAELIEMIEQFNLAIIKKYISIGAKVISYAEDLGMQVGPMISPDLFRKFIKPSYQRIMQPARDAGCIIHMHSDGDIKTLAADLIEGGVAILNLQDRVNGIDWIRDTLAGKVCIELDIDRQDITPNGTPQQIDALIREEVEKLGSRAGGLCMIYGMYPGVPLENARALMTAMEKYATLHNS